MFEPGISSVTSSECLICARVGMPTSMLKIDRGADRGGKWDKIMFFVLWYRIG